MARLIRADGTEQKISPANGQKFTLEELQEFVGGLIQIVKTRYNDVMIINEEGKLLGLNENRLATVLYTSAKSDDYIVGDAVIVEAHEMEE